MNADAVQSSLAEIRRAIAHAPQDCGVNDALIDFEWTAVAEALESVADELDAAIS